MSTQRPAWLYPDFIALTMPNGTQAFIRHSSITSIIPGEGQVPTRVFVVGEEEPYNVTDTAQEVIAAISRATA